MKKHSKGLRLTALFTALLTSLVLLIPLMISAEESNFDYSRPGSQYTQTANSADLLENLLGESLGKAEREYLVAFGDTHLKYDDGITTASVHTEFENGNLSVTVFPFNYTTVDGATVVWNPQSAELSGNVKALTDNGDGSFVTSYSSVDSSDESLTVNITFSLTLKLDADSANNLINKAYNDAAYFEKYIADQEALYEQKMIEYADACEEYKEYLAELKEYEDDKELYLEYLERKKIYDNASLEYAQYESDMALYKSLLEKYNAYQDKLKQYEKDLVDYTAYLAEMEEYNAEKAEYDVEASKYNACMHQLAAIELTKVKMTDLERDLYSSIMAGIVDLVLAEYETFTSPLIDAPGAVIIQAGRATELLRPLLVDYFSFKTDAAKYNYYTENYEGFRKGFVDLFTALDCLYSNSRVRSGMQLQGPGDNFEGKYIILIAQLYIVANAINDGPVLSVSPTMFSPNQVGSRYRKQFVYDESYYIFNGVDRLKVTDVLGNTKYYDDTDTATPAGGGLPTLGEAPVPPEYQEQPIPPGDDEYVKEPTVPTEVADPGDPPTVVNDPGDPPAEMQEPEEPKPYVPADEVLAIISAVKSGDITLRTDKYTQSPTVTFESVLKKRFINISNVDVIFRDLDGSLLYSTTVDSGSAADYSGPVPTKPTDDRAEYSFNGWLDEEGKYVDLSCVNESVILIPGFAEKIRSYTVSWNVDGTVTDTVWLYGSTPEYDSVPQKPADSENRYVFAGWDSVIQPVTGNVTYTAIFDAHPIVSAGGNVTVVFDGKDYLVDAGHTNEREFDLTYLLELAVDNAAVSIEANNMHAYLSPLLVDELRELENCKLVFRAVQYGEQKKYSVVISENGETVKPNGTVKVTFDGKTDAERMGRTCLRYVNEDGVYTYPLFNITAKSISFNAISGVEYNFGYEYRLSSPDSEQVKLSFDMPRYFSGDRVNISVTSVAEGYEIKKLSYYSAGEENEIFNGSFRMPASDISVLAHISELRYTVVFKNGNSVITTQTVKHGELPIAPEDPRKSPDESFTYVFAGWSEEISPATEDKIYTATYDPVPIVEKVSNHVSIYQRIIQVATIVLVVTVSACLLFGTIGIYRLKKRR